PQPYFTESICVQLHIGELKGELIQVLGSDFFFPDIGMGRTVEGTGFYLWLNVLKNSVFCECDKDVGIRVDPAHRTILNEMFFGPVFTGAYPALKMYNETFLFNDGRFFRFVWPVGFFAPCEKAGCKEGKEEHMFHTDWELFHFKGKS